MGVRFLLFIAIWLLSVRGSSDAATDTSSERPAPSAQSLPEYTGKAIGCESGIVSPTVSLIDVVQLALCSDIETRKAGEEIAMKIADRGLVRSDYWPTLTGNAGVGLSRDKTNVVDQSFYDSDISAKGYGGQLDLNWKLFDFGLTYQKSRSARFTVLAAIASRDSAVQTVTLNASQAFYDVLDAEAELAADNEAENLALETVASATARYASGIAALTDKLQAETAYSQAKVKRIAASGDLRDALGSLSILIGLEATADLHIDRSDDSVPDSEYIASIGALIDEAKLNNPDLLTARAAADSAAAELKAARVEGLPSIALVGTLNEQYQKPNKANNLVGFESTPADNSTYNRSIQLRVTIPLFSGFSRRYKVRSAIARAKEARIALDDGSRQVTLLVWKAYQSVRTQTESYAATSELVTSARESYLAAKGRYTAGVGTVIDILSSQSAMASANSQRIEALSKWRNAKLKLAASLGQLVQSLPTQNR
jgi:outer membrane protein